MAFVALSLLALASGVSAQSLSGLQAPVRQKAAEKQVMPIQMRVALGLAPLSKLYDQIKVEKLKIRRLPPLALREMQKATTEKRLRIGTVRALQNPLKISSDD